MSIAALIVAAGRGTRAGGQTAKQWQRVAGKSLLDHTIAAFRAVPEIGTIALSLPADAADAARHYRAAGLVTAKGGASRAASVLSGLRALQADGPDKVLIHDAARACIRPALISDVIAALDTYSAAAPGLAVSDALWTGENNRVTGTRDRSGLFAAQTPQGFDFGAILAAHAAHEGPAADDVEVARAAGMDVAILPGDPDNIKVTRPEDFRRAARILGGDVNIRLGNGFDVHRFGPGDHVILCGVRVAHSRGLQGHSDADVGLHALTDAILGGLAQGDIGQHFPPSEARWKDADSAQFLRHAVQIAAETGYGIGNLDCTLICEAPKIGPHAAAMRQAVAGIVGTDIANVSVKATTSERLGFTGRGEGIAAMATATLIPR